MPFKPGQSGNAAGRPPGIEDKRVRYRALLEPHAEALFATAIELATGGDTSALRLCIERLCPPLKAKDEPVAFALPDGATLTDTGHAILQAAADGTLNAGQAQQLLSALAAQAKLTETDELTRRIEALEQQHENTR